MLVPAPVNPKGVIGEGLSYDYVVELANGKTIKIRDSVKLPHRMNSFVSIEQSIRENGTQFYTFSRPANAYIPNH